MKLKRESIISGIKTILYLKCLFEAGECCIIKLKVRISIF